MSVEIRGAAVVLDLEEGWKTYAVEPGPYGYPPQVVAVDSANVRSWSLDWPDPSPQDAFGVPFLGYAGDVAIPLKVEPVDASLPSHLILRWDVAACSRVCVPVSASVAWKSAP